MNSDMHFRDLRELLENSEKLYSKEVAFKTKKKGAIEEVTYAQFASDIKNLGSYLLSLNMKNKRVAIISANRYEWSVAYFATVPPEILKLNSGICGAIRDLEIRLAQIQKTII